MILVSSSSASATSSRLRVLALERGSYNIVGGEEWQKNHRISGVTGELPGPASIQLTQTLPASNTSQLSGWTSPFGICQCDRTSGPPPQARGRGLGMDLGPRGKENAVSRQPWIDPQPFQSTRRPASPPIRFHIHPGQAPLGLRVLPFSAFLRDLRLLRDPRLL